MSLLNEQHFAESQFTINLIWFPVHVCSTNKSEAEKQITNETRQIRTYAAL